MGMKQKTKGIGTVTSKIVTRNWIQVLGPFTTPLVDIKIIKYQQEIVEGDGKVIIG